MAIIYTYPQAASLENNDLFVISQMNAESESTIRETRSISAANLADFLVPIIVPLIPVGPGGGPFLPLTAGSTVSLTGDLYMAPTGVGPSVGSNAFIFRGVDDVGTELDAAKIFTLDSAINPSGQDLYFQNADDNGVLQTNLLIDAFGQIGIQKTNPNFGLDVGGSTNLDTTLLVGTSIGVNMGTPVNHEIDVAGNIRVEGDNAPGGSGTQGTYWLGGNSSGDMNFGISSEGASTSTKKFYIGRAFNGITPFLTMWRTTGAPTGVEGRLQLNEYGAGNFTTGSGGLGAATYNLEVDASGNIIETTTGGGGGTFTAANSEATPHIVLGADAKANAPTGGADGVYICASSFGSATNNDEQINIGRDNDTNGTQSVAIGIDNSATTNSPYGMMFGKNNTTSGTRTWAFGEDNNMGTSDTVAFGKDNISTFTGGVSSGGLMNLSVGNENEVDCDKAIVVGWNNDLSGSFGWTIGGGKEVVVLGTRFSNTLLGPNRSGTNRSGPRVIIGTGSNLNTGVEEKRNSVEYYQPEATHSGVYHPALYNSASYADDAAASAGGVGLGELYRNGSIVQIRMT